MGKRDKRVVSVNMDVVDSFGHLLYVLKAWINPIAAARASGPKEVTGTTIRDYLDRDRPTM